MMESNKIDPTSMKPLKGQKLVVCGYELEQREHRGIAVFSKGLLRSLKKAGAEVWLLTETDPPMGDILSRPWVPKEVRRTVFTARLLDHLNSGDSRIMRRGTIEEKLRQIPIVGKCLNLLEQIRKQKRRVFPRQRINRNQITHIRAKEILNSPYQRCERLAYLQYVDGIVCAESCFSDSFSLARRHDCRTLKIDMCGFDGFITTSPLNIEPLNTQLNLQTVHDLIPLEYGRTLDHLPSFSRRLIAASKACRVFVSQDAEAKFNEALISYTTGTKELNPTRVLTQCPSLKFPGDALDWEARTNEIKVYSSTEEKLHNLRPSRFLLFNSSVVPHKNLLFALRAYMESGVEELGVEFCVTGQPQNDSYSKAVEKLVSKQKGVIFTGYVDEATKRQLYLNAMALISPSLVEGFGIPVLDAACLGMSVIASPIASHREIQRLHDFEKHIILCSTINTSDWASAMRLIALKVLNECKKSDDKDMQFLMNKKRAEKIRRYLELAATIDEEFSKGICELIKEDASSR